MILGPTLPLANMGHPLNQGLVGWWMRHASQGGGPLMPDISGRGSHGVLTNMGGDDWVGSPYGPALDFDASNDFIDIGSAALSPVIDTATTVICAVYIHSYSDNFPLIWNVRCASSTALRLYAGSAGGGYDAWVVGNVATGALSVSGVPATGVWHHIAVAGNTRVVINGINQATGGGVGLAGAPTNNRFGAETTSGNTRLNGRIGFVQAFGRLLSADELRQHYDQWLRGFPDTLVRQRSYVRGVAAKARPPFVNRRWNYWKAKV